MSCSPEKLASNRRNALKSTGPRTAEGKEASRRNSYKHGLTGEGIVLPDEDVAEVEARFAVFEEDLKPCNGVARFIARRAAMLSVRMERSCRQEAAGLTTRMLSAGATEQEARRREIEGHVASLDADPDHAVRHLRRTPEGLDWLVSAWLLLRSAILDDDPEAWTPAHADKMLRLLGHPPDGVHEAPGPDDRASIAAMIDAEVARLRADRDGLDHAAIARARAAASTRALFDPSKEAELARKYESAAERGFYKAIRDIERINAAHAEAVKADQTIGDENTSGDLASSLPADGPAPEPVADEPEPSPKRPSPPSIPAGSAPEGIPVYHFAEPVTYYPPIRE